MSRTGLTNCRPGGFLWWCYLLIAGYFAVGPIVFLVRSPVSAPVLAGTLGFCGLCLGVVLVLIGRLPRVAVRASDEQGMLRAWASGGLAGLLTAACLGVGLAGFSGAAPVWPVVVVGFLLALVTGFWLVRVTLGGVRTSAAQFGVRRPEPELPRTPDQPAFARRDDTSVFRPKGR